MHANYWHKFAGLVLGSQSALACAAVFLVGMPKSLRSPHELLRSVSMSSSASSGAEGSGSAGITQQSIPQVPFLPCSSVHLVTANVTAISQMC